MIIVNPKKELIQPIVDFDYMVGNKPSIELLIGKRESTIKLFYGNKEIAFKTIPIDEVKNEQIEGKTILNLSSPRSAYETTLPFINKAKEIIIVAEGMPISEAYEIKKKAKNTSILGPGSIGYVEGGKRKVGLAGGDYKNIEKSKLYVKGKWGIVSRSGGLLNEAIWIVSNYGATAKAISVGGELVRGTTMLKEMKKMEAYVDAFLIIGEVGGKEEIEIAHAIEEGEITKPTIAYIYGKSYKLLKEGSFGHASSMVDDEEETAEYKRKLFKERNIPSPEKWKDLIEEVKKTAQKYNLRTENKNYNQIPLNFKEALKKSLIRKHTSITSSISWDENGEITYRGIPISQLINKTVGDIASLLWFNTTSKALGEFLNLVFIITADHGPNVAGTHNAIVAARAGKDLVSSLSSGILTIGDRFGGAINNAADVFFRALKNGKTPFDIELEFKKKATPIPGYGHRVKSKDNPDKRVEILKNISHKKGWASKHLSFALELENLLLRKNPKLILNVDGAIAAIMLDILSKEKGEKEIEKYIKAGSFNAPFILGRTIGIMAHVIDQKLLNEPLYRHDETDVFYYKQ